MKNFRVEASYGRKITDGNFGSKQFHAGISCDLELGDNREEAYGLLWKEVESQVIRKVKVMKNKLREKE